MGKNKKQSQTSDFRCYINLRALNEIALTVLKQIDCKENDTVTVVVASAAFAPEANLDCDFDELCTTSFTRKGSEILTSDRNTTHGLTDAVFDATKFINSDGCNYNPQDIPVLTISIADRDDYYAGVMLTFSASFDIQVNEMELIGHVIDEINDELVESYPEGHDPAVYWLYGTMFGNTCYDAPIGE